MLSLSFAKVLCFVTLISLISCHSLHQTTQEIAKEVGKKIIYYGASVRLQHEKTKFHLHSHDLKYGSGSGQQSVTATKEDTDYNSLWTIKNQQGTPFKLPDEKVLCGDVVRLEHVLTKKNLHSHDFRAPVSGKFEVSCFGNDGNGDDGDNWKIICEKNKEGTPLKGYTSFYLQHLGTNRYLFTDHPNSFNHRNCGHNCPIMGQLEIAADGRMASETRWQITSGLFYLFDEESDSDGSSNTRERIDDDL